MKLGIGVLIYAVIMNASCKVGVSYSQDMGSPRGSAPGSERGGQE